MARHLINMTGELIKDLQGKYQAATEIHDKFKGTKSFELGILAAGVMDKFKTMLEVYRTYCNMYDFVNHHSKVDAMMYGYHVIQGAYNDLREQKKIFYEVLAKFKLIEETRDEFYDVLSQHCPANKKNFKKVPDSVLMYNAYVIHNLKALKVIYKCRDNDDERARKAVKKVKWPDVAYTGRRSKSPMNKPFNNIKWMSKGNKSKHMEDIALYT